MSSAWEKAHQKYLRFKQKIDDLLQKERPADKNDLMNYKSKGVFTYSSVAIGYPAFPMWLFRFDDLLKLPLTVSINSFRFQREKHQRDVIDELVNIHIRRAGQALFKEMEGTGKRLWIEPYWSFGKTAYNNDNALFPQLGPNATEQRSGKPDAKKRTNALIKFTPSMWGKPSFDPKTNLSTGTSGVAGPASGADEVLFHEMVHASRDMRGVSEKQSVDKGYDNSEEFFAIVLANVYLAEKKQKSLRANHEGHATLASPEKFLDNVQQINPSPKTLLARLFNEQQRFFKELADITEQSAWWNPVRDFGRQTGVTK